MMYHGQPYRDNGIPSMASWSCGGPACDWSDGEFLGFAEETMYGAADLYTAPAGRAEQPRRSGRRSLLARMVRAIAG